MVDSRNGEELYTPFSPRAAVDQPVPPASVRRAAPQRADAGRQAFTDDMKQDQPLGARRREASNVLLADDAA